MLKQINSAVSSATDDFKAVAISAGLGISTTGVAATHLGVGDDQLVPLGFLALLASAACSGAVAYYGLSGLAKVREEAQEQPQPSQPPKIQP